MPYETATGGNRPGFEPTEWTLILKAKNTHGLGTLIDRYWKPCYFYIRHRGYDVEDAKDLTQSFFTDLLERKALADVDASKGRFRSFLLACLNHFLANESDRRKARKRFGKRVSFDFESAEQLLAKTQAETPKKIYRRQWATEVVEQALQTLKKEMGPRFEALRMFSRRPAG